MPPWANRSRRRCLLFSFSFFFPSDCSYRCKVESNIVFGYLRDPSIHPSGWPAGRPPGPSASLQRRIIRKMTQKNLIASRPTSPESLVVCCCCCNRVCAVARNVIEKQTNNFRVHFVLLEMWNKRRRRRRRRRRIRDPFDVQVSAQKFCYACAHTRARRTVEGGVHRVESSQLPATSGSLQTCSVGCLSVCVCVRACVSSVWVRVYDRTSELCLVSWIYSNFYKKVSLSLSLSVWLEATLQFINFDIIKPIP